MRQLNDHKKGWGLTSIAIALGISAVLASATTSVISASNAHQQRKAMKSAAHAADMRAQEIARKQAQAKADAEAAARDKTRRRILAIEGSETYLTKGEELDDPLIETPTLLGV